MDEVFISYKREEREAITTMVERLRALRVEVWFDAQLQHRSGFDEEIAEHLSAARCVVVCWTPAAIASEWVRGEAALAHGDGKLVACFLEPTRLLPPFNLQQTEDLMRWAGQDDDPGWIRLLAAIGEKLDRPGLASATAAMAPGAPVQALKQWLKTYGDDPLAEPMIGRLRLLEGEDAAAQAGREALEARTHAQRRKADDARSKALAAARGLRDPAEQRRRLLLLGGGVVLVGLAAAGGIGWTLDAQRRSTALGHATTPEQLRAFIDAQRWHPVADEALRRYQALDTAAWLEARSDGRITAIERYLAMYAGSPPGQFLAAAQTALVAAKQVQTAQLALLRLQLYRGEAHGALDAATRLAVQTFRYRAGQPVQDGVDAGLVAALERTLAALATLPPSALRAARTGEPIEDDYLALAARTGLEAPTLYALRRVEGGPGGFDSQGRPWLVFETQVFSRLTKHLYDEGHPDLAAAGIHRPAPPDRQWALLAEAHALDADAAYRASSFGMFAILGENYRRLGFASAGEMAWFSAQSESNQLELLVRYLHFSRDLDRLKQRDWRAFARSFNGPSAEDRQYPGKLAAAYDEGLRRLGFFAQVMQAPAPAPPLAASVSPASLPTSAPKAAH